MGEQGIISRVLGVRAGSVFTFGAAMRGEETAPGQVPANELRDVYRIDMVDQATQVYGVVGDPLSHSLSPVMMNAAFRRESVNAVYLALHAKSMKDFLACVQEIPNSRPQRHHAIQGGRFWRHWRTPILSPSVLARAIPLSAARAANSMASIRMRQGLPFRWSNG